MRARLAALFAGTMLVGLAVGRPARADGCDANCDVWCKVCCKTWVLRAQCKDGKTASVQGAFTVYAQALAASEAANKRASTCTAQDSGQCKDFVRCGAEEVAIWGPHCAPDQIVVTSAEAAAAAVELDALAALCAGQLSAIGDVEPKLAAVVEGSSLTDKAKKKAAVLRGALPTYKVRITELRDKAIGMRDARNVTAAEAKKLRAGSGRLLREALDAVVAARALIVDQASADRGSADRARKKAEAESAARARKEAADAAAAKAAEEAAARKQAAEADRKSKTTAAEASRAQGLDKDIDQVTRAIEEVDALISSTDSIVSGFLSRSDLTEAAKKQATALSRKLFDLKSKATGGRASLAAARRKRSAAAVAGVRRTCTALLKDAQAAAADTKVLIDARASYVGDPGAVPSNQPPPLPDKSPNVCELLFEGADGAAGLSVSIDGGAAASLPTRLKIVSGRHAIVVKQGKASEQRSELLLCRRLTRVEVLPPKP